MLLGGTQAFAQVPPPEDPSQERIGRPPAEVSAQLPPPDDHFRYSIWAGFDYTDNVERGRDGGSGALLFVPGLHYSVLNSGRRWRVRGEGEVRTERTGNDSGVEPRVRASLLFDWALLPHRLYWSFQEFADVQSIDPLAPDDPSNRQQTKLFQTGPILVLGSPRSFLTRIEAQLARADAESSPDFDHQRMLLSAWVTRQTDPVQSWAAGLESGDVDFDRGRGSRDFRRHDLLLRHQRELRRSTFAVTVGMSHMEPDDGGDLSRPLLRVRMRYAPERNTEFSALLRHELSDAGRELAQERNPTSIFRTEARRSLIGSEIYRLAAADLGWYWRGARTEVRVNAFGRDYDYLRSTLQAPDSSRGFQVGLMGELTPVTRIRAGAGSESFTFENSPRRDRDRFLNVSFERDFSPHWKLRVGLERQEHLSTLGTLGFTENIASLHLIYTGGQWIP